MEILPILLLVAAVFLFMSFRNQKKRTAAMAEMQKSAVDGARVQLHAGLFGTVVGESEGDTVDVEIAPGVVTTWNRLAIREVLAESDAAAESVDTPGDDLIPDSAATGDDSYNPDHYGDDPADSGIAEDGETGEKDAAEGDTQPRDAAKDDPTSDSK